MFIKSNVLASEFSESTFTFILINLTHIFFLCGISTSKETNKANHFNETRTHCLEKPQAKRNIQYVVNNTLFIKKKKSLLATKYLLTVFGAGFREEVLLNTWGMV